MQGSFLFRGQSYEYCLHTYNGSWNNERTVEVPIIWEIVKANQGKRILEFGNVLSYYFDAAHDILDKYEIKPGVINQDALFFNPPILYDLIVSISTLEHVGWDEDTYSAPGGTGQIHGRDPSKPLVVVDVLRRCLVDGGKMVFTFPVGQNPSLDQFLMGGILRFDECFGMKRVSPANEWVETPWTEVMGTGYGFPYPNGNAIIIGMITRNGLKSKKHLDSLKETT